MRAPYLDAFESSELRLVPFEEKDVGERYVSWMRNPAIIRYTEVEPDSATLDNCRAYVRSNNESANAVLWRILAGADGHVGNIRLEINHKHWRGELALIVGRPDLQGRGIGTESICMVSEYAIETLNLHKLTCGIYAKNVASIKAFERNGFRVEATFSRHVFADGVFQDVLRFARFATDTGTP